jgi:hypothetical protein
MTTDTQTLADFAFRSAARAAADFLERNQLVADVDTLAQALKRHCKSNMRSAVNDACDAFDCGMTMVGEATFRASMALAGVAAAKEVGQSKGGVA